MTSINLYYYAGKLADYQENVRSCSPFYDLTDREFHAMVGSWQLAGLTFTISSQIQINPTSATQI